MATLLWICLGIIGYTFIGYGLILYCLVLIRRAIFGPRPLPVIANHMPSVAVVVAAFNEENCISAKIENTLSLHYPGRVEYLFVSDGSTDSTPNIISKYSDIRLLHEPERRGKIAAMERAAAATDAEILVFTDANTILNRDALLNICRHYRDASVGAVSGEKKVSTDGVADATAGEGFYWKYESKLKQWDSELYTVVGAAGELFSVRRCLYSPVPPDTILDDFIISMRIAEQGYRIIYEPAAYAAETASENIREELKRKIRIAAGGIQSVMRLSAALNPFHNFLLSFQYVSHRVLRWLVTPFLLVLAFLVNLLIIVQTPSFSFMLLFFCQVAFYSLSILGLLLDRLHLRVRAFYIPYYFCMMNYAVVAGIRRYMLRQQTTLWEKAKRK